MSFEPKQIEMICLEDLVPENHIYRKFQTLWNLKPIRTELERIEADDLVNQKLLLHGCRPLTWRDYLKSLEVKSLRVKKLDLKHDGSFQHFFMLIKAAKDGLGIVLIPDFLIKNELENGSLVKIFTDDFESGYNYYLINPKQKSHLQKIVDFKSWVKEISVF